MARDRKELDSTVSPHLLPQVAAFVAVVSAGSFSAAARRLHVDKSLLSRRVRALEEALEVRLLNRTTRQLHVTEAGKSLYERVQAPLADIAAGIATAARSEGVHGLVRVATLPALGPCLWGDVMRSLTEAHPKLRLEIRATETLVNLIDQGFDLAVRSGAMPDSSLIARRLCTWRYILVSSPEWLARHPELRSPVDLADHWILYDDVPLANHWRFERGTEGIEVHVESRVATDNGDIQLGALLAGMGVTAAAPFHVSQYVERGELVRVLPEWRVVHQHGIFAVTPHRSYTPASVVVVRDAVAAALEQLAAGWRALTE